MVTIENLKVGGKYNWEYQPERLSYMGRDFNCGRFWYQFEKLDAPGKVWCEVPADDLRMFEESKP